MRAIDVDKTAEIFRTRSVDITREKVLIARIKGALQESDLTKPPTSQGYGRIHHFRMNEDVDWIPDPLPNFPAAKALKRDVYEVQLVQIYQLAACNFDCWFCFVDKKLRTANHRTSHFFTADELVQLYLSIESRPDVIDLTGGHPDLVPEWIYWMMLAVEKHNLAQSVYLWSDDNLSVPYLWKYLSEEQIQYMANYSLYGRVGTFKGYDAISFSFNTRAPERLYYRQFEIFKRLLLTGFDMYGYVVFTSPEREYSELKKAIITFVDDLQRVHHYLPLRVVPLKIKKYTPMIRDLDLEREVAMKFQYKVLETWLDELHKRFSTTEMETPITDISLK